MPTLQVDAGSRVQLQYSRVEEMQHASPTPPVDASSLGGMTACRGAPLSCANASCTMLHNSPHCRWMPRIRDAGSRVQLQYFRVEEMQYASPTLPVDAPSRGGMTAHWGAPSSCAICNMHHATCYSHLRPATICVIDALLHLCPATATFVLTYCLSAPCYCYLRTDILLRLRLATAICILNKLLHLVPATLEIDEYVFYLNTCPRFPDDGLWGVPLSCANATHTKHHTSPTLHVDALLFGNRQLATYFAHSTDGCPASQRNDDSQAAPSSHPDAMCNSPHTSPTP